MHVLIVEANPALGLIWTRHLERLSARVVLVDAEGAAIQALTDTDFEVIILNLDLAGGIALTVADFASYRQPEARVIFVTNAGFFSDGSIFQFFGNAAALLPCTTPPEDLAALVEHHAATGSELSRP
ncbi:hypothetical protein [Marinovum sp.]|uniref:hypothetical protein n=1 Tax=Marinovum sp. TaxID=2024839 RepID=UPI002B273A23|nr:hypothetical protein [Marinovum sp.]